MLSGFVLHKANNFYENLLEIYEKHCYRNTVIQLWKALELQKIPTFYDLGR